MLGVGQRSQQYLPNPSSHCHTLNRVFRVQGLGFVRVAKAAAGILHWCCDGQPLPGTLKFMRSTTGAALRLSVSQPE